MKTDNEKLWKLTISAEIYLKKLGNFSQLITASQRWNRTSYLFGVGKVTLLQKALKKDKIGLLQCFQNEEDKEMKSTKKFVQTIMYPGKDNISVADTRS